MTDSAINTERSLSASEVQTFVTNSLVAAGVRADVAAATAEGLVWASLRGVDSHGIRLLPHYLAGIEGGRINPDPQFRFEQTASAAGVLEADHGFGHGAGVVAMRHAIELARLAGAGHIVVRNSSHCGALGYFAEMACLEDMIGFAMTHATARMRAPGGKRAFVGTNPICCAAPMNGEDPFCYDAAQSRITFNAVKRHAELGRALAPGLAADCDGVETIDPKMADQLIPIGDHKGYGLAMVVELMCAMLTGMPAGPDVSRMYGDPMNRRRELGHYFAALSIDAFQPVSAFRANLTAMARKARLESALDPAVPVMVPGDPEKAIATHRRAQGIPISPNEFDSFLEIACRYGIAPPAGV